MTGRCVSRCGRTFAFEVNSLQRTHAGKRPMRPPDAGGRPDAVRRRLREPLLVFAARPPSKVTRRRRKLIGLNCADGNRKRKKDKQWESQVRAAHWRYLVWAMLVHCRVSRISAEGRRKTRKATGQALGMVHIVRVSPRDFVFGLTMSSQG